MSNLFAKVERGSQKEHIRDLQSLINIVGHYSLLEDGILGAKTLLAVWSSEKRLIALYNDFADTRGIELPRLTGYRSRKRSRKQVDVADMVRVSAMRYGVNSEFAIWVAETESGLNPKAISKTKAMGVFQLTSPAVADVVARQPKFDRPNRETWLDIDWNIAVGVNFLKIIMEDYLKGSSMSDDTGFLTETYAAYNLGIGNLRKLRSEKFSDPGLLAAFNVQAPYLREGGIEQYLGIVQSRIESRLIS